MRFQQQHPEVGFRRLAYPFPHWMAYWMAGSEVQGRTNTDFGVLLGEVSEVFGWEDRGEEKGAAGR